MTRKFFKFGAILLAVISLNSCLAGKYMCNYALRPTPHGTEDIERTRHKADSLMPGSTAWYDGLKQAGILIFLAPLLVLYLFAQRWLVENLESSGLVG